MPRLSNPKLKGRHTRKTPNISGKLSKPSTGAPAPAYHQFFVTLLNIQGTGYIERFMKRYPSCNYAEYYVVPNNDETHDLFAYVQLRYPVPVGRVSSHLPFVAKVESTTVAEKLASAFHTVPDKLAYGVERAIPQKVAFVENTPFKTLHTAVQFGLQPVKQLPVNVPCWLPQPSKPDPLLNRKRIYPINHDDD